MRLPQPPPRRPSLIEHTAQTLRDGLAAGIWQTQLPGERELSLHLLVSRPTLRAALSLLQKEGRLASQQGRPHRITAPAHSLLPCNSKIVRLLSPLPLQQIPPFALCWIDHLRERLASEGLQLEIHSGPKLFTHQPSSHLASLVEHHPAAAWVLFMATERMQRWFLNRDIPTVLAGSSHPGIPLPSVDLDYRAVCRHAAGQFLAHGHRQIVFVRQSANQAGDDQSLTGFLEAFHDGTTPLVAEHDGSSVNIRKQVAALLRRPLPPSAFLVARSMPALTVASELIRLGRRLGREAAVLCRDSDHFLDFFSPSLARYEADPSLHARRLAHAILHCVRHLKPRTHQVRLMPNFRPGESFA